MIPVFCVALTFDDGYIEHYRVARLLNRLGIKATFFIITHLTRFEGKRLLTSRPKLIEEINQMGHQIGSHTKTHPNLTSIPLHKVEEEARESKQLLEDLTGNEVRGFAYPYGAYNTNIVNIIGKHYEYARGSGANPSESPFNAETKNRYILGVFAKGAKDIRRILQLPTKLIEHGPSTCIRIAIMMHKESLSEILALITYLRLLPGETRFLTMSELLELSRNGTCSI